MKTITVKTEIKETIQTVWKYWTKPEHIIKWNFATPEWHCPEAKNDLVQEGEFNWRMEAKDGSMGFDYEGKYLDVDNYKSIHQQLGDGRKVNVSFTELDNFVEVVETFEVEDENSAEMQRQGWQAILNNFKIYAEKK